MVRASDTLKRCTVIAIQGLAILFPQGRTVAEEKHTWYNVRNREKFERLIGKNISVTGEIFYCKDGPLVHSNDKKTHQS